MSKDSPAGAVTFYIQMDDVTDSLEEVEKAGGLVAAPEVEIPNIGKSDLFRDPQGNLVGLFKPYPRA